MTDTELEPRLEEAVQGYMAQCYAGEDIPQGQMNEIRQAFLSGVFWLSTALPDETLEFVGLFRAIGKMTGIPSERVEECIAREDNQQPQDTNQ